MKRKFFHVYSSAQSGDIPEILRALSGHLDQPCILPQLELSNASLVMVFYCILHLLCRVRFKRFGSPIAVTIFRISGRRNSYNNFLTITILKKFRLFHEFIWQSAFHLKRLKPTTQWYTMDSDKECTCNKFILSNMLAVHAQQAKIHCQ